MITQFIHDHHQGLLSTMSLASFGAGFSMAGVNEVLQAFAFLTAIASGSLVIWNNVKGNTNEDRKAE